MTTADLFEVTFQQSLEHAKQVAGYLLRSSLGAHTSEDVVSTFIEKELRKGKSLSEIQETLSSSGIYRRLRNTKNDIFSWETAAKRGKGLPCESFEEEIPHFKTTMDEPVSDLFLGTFSGNPELELIRKEELSTMKNILTRLLEMVELSETQMKILGLDQRGYSNKQIARELGIDIEVVYARRSEALRKLAAAARRISETKK
jgi:DNA-binding CsgD family transcriptional regulator